LIPSDLLAGIAGDGVAGVGEGVGEEEEGEGGEEGGDLHASI